MSFEDILDNVMIVNMKNVKQKDFINAYNKSLEYLNILKVSRHKANMVGGLIVGENAFDFKDEKEFKLIFMSAEMLILNTLYEMKKNDIVGLVSDSLCILHAILAQYMVTFEIEPDRQLIEENENYCTYDKDGVERMDVDE